MTAEQIAAQRAIFIALKGLCDGESRADSRALVAMLIARASWPAPPPAVTQPGCGGVVRGLLFGEHWIAFSELLRAVFNEAQRQGPRSNAAACLRLLAAMVPDLDVHDGRTVLAVMDAIRAAASSWQPASLGHDDRRST